MRRQRNNVQIMPYEQRKLVNRLLFDGSTYAEIAAEVARLFPGSPKLHSSSLGAWQRGPEFTRYRAARQSDEVETAQTRAMAEALNDGRGPESMADLTVMEVVKELYRQTRGGQITELADLANVTKALAPLLRAKIAADLAEARQSEAKLKTQIADLKAQMEAERIALEQENDSLRAEIAALKNNGQAVDPKAVADRMNDVLGVKKA